MWASPSGGKSVCAGKIFVAQDHKRRKPVIVIDPLGTITDNALPYLDPARVIYADMSATDYTVPFPLYHRYGSESLFDMVQRYPETVRLADPALLIAPIQGFNPFSDIATNLGILLHILDLPIIAAPLLLRNPDAFKAELIAKRTPETGPAIDMLFHQYKKKTSTAEMYRIKIMPFLNDQSLQAICCAPRPGIDWDDVVANGKTVLLDFRHVINDQKKSFLLLWTLKSFLTYIRMRPRHTPVTLVIDELKALFLDPTSEQADSAIAKELIQLLEVYARNMAIWPVLLSQDPLSFGPKVQQSLLGIGTQIIGGIHNTDAATLLASHLIPQSGGWGTVRDNAYYSGQRLKSLQPFHFLVRPATSKGISSKLYPVTIENLVTQWEPRERIEETRQRLKAASGERTDTLLSAITSQLSRLTMPDAHPQRGTMKRNDTHSLPEQDNDDDVI